MNKIKLIVCGIRNYFDPWYISDYEIKSMVNTMEIREDIEKRLSLLGFNVIITPFWTGTICRIYDKNSNLTYICSLDELNNKMIMVLDTYGRQ